MQKDGIFSGFFETSFSFVTSGIPMNNQQSTPSECKIILIIFDFSSEMKTIEDICGNFELATFPPGHFWTPSTGFVRYYAVSDIFD
ncbi:unnamed protein product [Gongylonema pulchrum]|uniref:VWFA domain-containing protein n=1 Tax=Gongylonema pulchrum TaxID=637853 RepID=A0A183EV26_9BILA|nr:unnamed protein product [Gongylonema pulchrum]